MKKRISLALFVKLLSLGVATAAVVKELRTPKPERRWHGKVAGIVPYDFRLPTADRVKETVWDPDSSQILKPQAFGVGWSLNLGRVVRLVSGRRGAAQPQH